MYKKGLKPIIDKDTQTLILGSLPSDESIRQQKYYAKFSNDFWKILGKINHIDLHNFDYKEKINFLLEKKIGLWDVFSQANRQGSMDSKFKETKLNDFSNLKDLAPNLKYVFFNGKKAGDYEDIFRKNGYKTKILPSSSGANRRNQIDRIKEWKAIFKE